MSLDPLAEIEPSWSAYRYVFDNPIMFIDPDGLYEWRINSETGEMKKIGEEGGDETQYIYWDDAKKPSASMKGKYLYTGAVSTDRYKDGEVTIAVSNVDLWEGLPAHYEGAYTMGDLRERRRAMLDGGVKYESILEQEAAGLGRREMIWNAWDYGQYMDTKFGSRDGYLIAFDTGLIQYMIPGGSKGGVMNKTLEKLKGITKPNSVKGLSKAKAFKFVSPKTSLSKNPWIRFLQKNKGRYKGLGKRWIKKAAADYKKLNKI